LPFVYAIVKFEFWAEGKKDNNPNFVLWNCAMQYFKLGYTYLLLPYLKMFATSLKSSEVFKMFNTFTIFIFVAVRVLITLIKQC
jgi:hypothetical protein